MFLHYVVKCVACYYCTVDNTLLHAKHQTASVHQHFEHVTGEHAIELDDVDSVVHV